MRGLLLKRNETAARDKAVVLLMDAVDWKAGEIRHLLKDHVKVLSDGLVRVNTNKIIQNVRVSTKSNVPVVDLEIPDPSLVKAIRGWLACRPSPTNSYMFLSGLNQQMTERNIQDRYQRYKEQGSDVTMGREPTIEPQQATGSPPVQSNTRRVEPETRVWCTARNVAPSRRYRTALGRIAAH